MFSPIELEQPSFYKCHFCDIIFTSFPSIARHKNLYCALRNELPRSATVTSSMALDNLSSSENKNNLTSSEKSSEKELTDDQSSDIDVVGVSDESSSSSGDSESLENAMTSSEGMAEYLQKKFSSIHKLGTVTPVVKVKQCTKRKMTEVEQESKDGSSSYIDENRKYQKSWKQSS